MERVFELLQCHETLTFKNFSNFYQNSITKSKMNAIKSYNKINFPSFTWDTPHFLKFKTKAIEDIL